MQKSGQCLPLEKWKGVMIRKEQREEDRDFEDAGNVVS